jgi:hypothetical protein
MWIGAAPLPAATSALPIKLESGQLECAASSLPPAPAAAASAASGQ